MEDNYNYSSGYDKLEEKKTSKNYEEEEFKASDLGQNNYKEYIPKIFEDENFKFSVANPVLQGGHIVYTVKGVDSNGSWEG